MHKYLAAAVLVLCPAVSLAEEMKAVALPPPQTEGGMPLMQALKERKSSRSFDARKVPMEVLSNLLWAASGINRPDGRRTSPTASNRQEIDIYAATADGLFLYQPKGHQLLTVVAEDLRALAGRQDYVRDAPLDLIYVADMAKAGNGAAEEKATYTGADTGFIGQNVYLYCTSQGLATVIRAMIDRPALAKAMRLRPDQKIILSQTVGYPKP